MTFRILDAVADAMAHLKTSDVAGATSTLRDTLMGGGVPAQRATIGYPFNAPMARRLADVLKVLKARRGEFPSLMPRPTPKSRADDPHFTSRTLNSAWGTMNYKLYVPEHRAREPALVLMLHGCTQDPDDFARGTRMNRLADEFGLIVAYPHQPRSANAQGCWNWFDRRHQSAGSGEPAMLAALAQTVSVEFGIAPERVFAAGLSAGAAMADVLAEAYPEVFSRVGLHSGMPHLAAHDVMSAFAAMKGGGKAGRRGAAGRASRKIIIHGTADSTVHPSNSDEIFERMRARVGASSIILTNDKTAGRKVTRQVLIGPMGEALAEHLLIEGGGHAWSGGDGGGSYADPVGPDASREIVEFFLRDFDTRSQERSTEAIGSSP
ncbi:MAG TPA: PHB depolymerase family esterase [Bosea sp. (in: a-proteobacteria)]|jgi:poly(hydroxyalkanoate) depolymerase family esterase|uniref:extracellular catalytic domain type 1 short-chain-length polyhydroxyalkanoate depolymerase n=1 Tax=Bosea sp. (in: a-proteobacteria) TaxID=1871050 RepID=UPI002E10186B|nr:PHB depolymerase family esterase [Bosea sp. (in: a-proteobacteria)]